MERMRERERKRRRDGESLHRRAALALRIMRWLMMTALVGSAATPFEEYASRIEQAAKMVKTLVKGEHADAEIRGTLKVVAQMLPATEDIEFGREVVHVDNAWLHQTISALSHENGVRQQQLVEIYHRLDALARRLKSSNEIKADESAAERARL